MSYYLDTCILIDLNKLGLLDKEDLMPNSFAVSRTVIHDELMINSKDIYKYALDNYVLVDNVFQDLVEALNLQRENPRLSKYDCLGAVLCKKHAHIMITSDKNLRKQCETLGIEVHGLYWLIKCFIDIGNNNLLNYLKTKIKNLIDDPNAWYKKEELEKLIQDINEKLNQVK